MRTTSARTRVLVLTTVVGLWGMLTYACSIGIENPALPDSGTSTTPSTTNPTGDGAIVSAAICGKYGGSAGVDAIADAMLAAATADCRIGSTVNPASHAQTCWELFIESVFQCGAPFVLGTTKDFSETCNSYLPDITMSANDFAAFSDDSSGALTAKAVAPADIQTIMAAVAQTQSVLVSADAAAAYTKCTCDAGDACTPPVVDAGPKDSGPPPPKDSGPKDTGPKDTGPPPSDAATAADG